MIHISIDFSLLFYCFSTLIQYLVIKKLWIYLLGVKIMHCKPVIVLVIICLFVTDVKSIIVHGKSANFSAVLQRIMDIGDGIYPNEIPGPDLSLGRKSFGNSVILVVQNGKNSTKSNKNQDIRESYNKAIRTFMDLKKNRQEKRKAELVETQHKRKVNEIVEFLNEYYLSTNYLYDEVQRIKKQRKVKDDLRRMVEYLERPDKVEMKAEVLQCYYDKRKSEVLTFDSIDKHQPNNLIINILKDPYNDGFIN